MVASVTECIRNCAERLRRELYDSQQDNASLESSLRCKVQLSVATL